jgi:hypothetical protein
MLTHPRVPSFLYFARKVTIEKKDKINEYKKRKRQKEERTSVPRPLSWNIYVKKQCRHINRAGYNNGHSCLFCHIPMLFLSVI